MDAISQVLPPLIGVAVGWALGQVGTMLQRTRDDRRALGIAVYHLLQQRRELIRIHSLMKGARDLWGEGPHLEPHRVHLLSTHLGGVRPYEETIKALAVQLPSVDPTLAFELQAQTEALLSQMRAPMDAIATVPAAYASMWMLQEETYLAALGNTEDGLLRLCRRRSLTDWWRMRRWLKIDRSKGTKQWSTYARKALETFLPSKQSSQGDTDTSPAQPATDGLAAPQQSEAPTAGGPTRR